MSVAVDQCPAGPVADAARLAALDGYAVLDTPAEAAFDDLAWLAARICGAPTALVSLVAADRQWFKGRVGFPLAQTGLDSSVCAHALSVADLLVIPDLARDPRTETNPLVTGAPGIRFYAGAPLRTPGGYALGSLCVIDTAPRPQGLAPDQADGLRRLARQVMAQLELRRLATQRREEDIRHRQVLASALDYAIVTLGLDGNVTGWSEGARELLGWSEAEMLGRPADAFFTPEDVAAGVPAREMREAREQGRGRDERWHRRRDGGRFWASGEMMPLNAASGAHVGYLKVLRDRTEQHLAGRRLAESEARYRGLFEQLQEGFVLGEVVRDGEGRAVDWRYLEVNRAWSDLLGRPAEAVIGRTIRGLLPGVEDAWVDEFAAVVATGDSATFTRRVGTLDRWYEGRAHRVDADTFMVLFLEVTDRILAERARETAERHKTALLELGDRLRETDDAGRMAYAAAEVMGRALGATRAGYGTVDVAAETVVMEPDWHRPGVASIAGLHRFRDYGSFIDDLKRGEMVVLADATTDPRTRASAEALVAIGIRTLVNVPLIEHGQLVAVLYIHHDEPHVWTGEDLAFVRGVADRTRAAIARVRAEEMQRLRAHELSHRLKNTLAMVQAIVAQTMRSAADIEEAKEVLAARLVALGRAHDILMTGEGESAGIREVLEGALRHHADDPERLRLDGPGFRVGAGAALSLALMAHELATNALKYGALSTPGGTVDLAWGLHEVGGEPTVTLRWVERGGPPVEPPTRQGFGSRLIERGLAGQVGGEVATAYAREGVTCTLVAPLSGFRAGS